MVLSKKLQIHDIHLQKCLFWLYCLFICNLQILILVFFFKAFFNVFRLRDKVVTTMTETAKRYVITNPSFDFGLLPTDQVSVLPPLVRRKKKYESVQLQNINHYFISTRKLIYFAIDTLILLVWHFIVLQFSPRKVPYLFPESIKSDSKLKSSA